MVIYPESFSIKPNIEATVCFRNLFSTVSQSDVNKNLTLTEGNYVFCSKNADERKYNISNTLAPEDYKDYGSVNCHKTALVIENVKNMEIDFNNSNFIMDGKMTHILIKNCEKLTLKNLNIEAVFPDVHKVTVLKATPFYITFKIDEHSRYVEEENGNYFWYGTDYKTGFTDNKNSGEWMLTAKPSNFYHLSKNQSHPFYGITAIRQVSDRVFKARFICPKDYEAGQVFYFFPRGREEVGICIDSSKDIVLKNIRQRSNYGHSIVAQNSDNITIDEADFSPNPEYPAALTSFGEFLRFSMCRGKIRVVNSNLDAAADDACNVHGFHFKIVKSEKDKMTVQFSQRSSYGFDCIRDGDIIAFIDPKTLLEVGRTKVLHATPREGYYYDLVLTTYDPALKVGGFIENVSASPDFEFSGNTLNRIAGAGVSVTTRGRVRIENNKFLNTAESGIVICGDTDDKYESGCITDAVIRRNAFMNCEENAILIKPESRRNATPVHRNIIIENNLFIANGSYALNVSGCDNIFMGSNVYKGKPANRKWVNSRYTENIVIDCPKN